MKVYIRVLLALFAMACLAACNENEQFEEEQYKKVIYLESDDNQIFSVVHSLAEETSTGYFSIGCGGTNPIEEDVTVELEPDDVLLDKYNKSNFDIDTVKFAKVLSPSRYSMAALSITLRAGDGDPYALLPIVVRPEGLSPDSTYFVPMRIKSVSNYEVNPKKNNVLYRVYIENYYAGQKTTTQYSVKGTKQEDGQENPQVVSVTKPLQPLTKDRVRMFAGNQAYKSDVAEINKWAVILQVGGDNLVTVLPYGTIEVEQLGDPADNRYHEESEDYKRFFLHYRYRTLNKAATETEPAEWSKWVTMKETLRRLEAN